MAVLIKGFEFPKDCMRCQLHELCTLNGAAFSYCKCLDGIKAIPVKGKRLDCPLVLCEDDRVPCIDESLNNIMEEVCEICMYRGDYKDPDDLIRERCNDCKVVERVDKVLYGSTHT